MYCEILFTTHPGPKTPSHEWGNQSESNKKMRSRWKNKIYIFIKKSVVCEKGKKVRKKRELTEKRVGRERHLLRSHSSDQCEGDFHEDLFLVDNW